MAKQPQCFSSKTSVCDINELYVLARAVRNRSRVDSNQMKIENEASYPNILNYQNYLQFQKHEGTGNRNNSAVGLSIQQKTHHPLNMVVSKAATRRPSQENPMNHRDKLDVSNLRKTKLPPPLWREKELHTKRLQSAYFHNRRKIEEILRMKTKLKCPKYDPNDLLQVRRYQGLQNLSNSQMFQRKDQESSQRDKFPHIRDGSQRTSGNKSREIESEDDVLNYEKENLMFRSPPAVQQSKEHFVFNPVLSPVSKSFGSAFELLKDHYSPKLEDSHAKEMCDSPGNHTTSSTSSGLTIAEETLRVTYHIGRYQSPPRCQDVRSFMNDGLSSIYPESSDSEWLPQRRQPGFLDCFEE